MSRRDFSSIDTDRLAALLRTSLGDAPAWGPQELAAIFRHQFSVPIDYDLSALSAGSAGRLKVLASSSGLLVRSFGDLFRHPNPPLELLKLTKQFAKANRSRPDAPLPPEIATLLYYCSIAAALVRCHQRITEQGDLSLVDAFTWCRDIEWVDDATRALFEQALHLLRKDTQA